MYQDFTDFYHAPQQPEWQQSSLHPSEQIPVTTPSAPIQQEQKLTAEDRADPERRLRAMQALLDGTMVVRHLDRGQYGAVTAFVETPEGKRDGYAVWVSGDRQQTKCSCADSYFRNVVCKHALAVLMTLREQGGQQQVFSAPSRQSRVVAPAAEPQQDPVIAQKQDTGASGDWLAGDFFFQD